MSDPLGGFVPETVKNDEPAREAVIRLAKVVTDRAEIILGKEKLTKESPEYWGIAPLVTDLQCEIGILMKKRKPRTFADMKKICKKLNLSDDQLLKELEEMSYNGISICLMMVHLRNKRGTLN